MKKIVIAIDSFKGCLSSVEAGEAGGMGGGLLASHPERLSLGEFLFIGCCIYYWKIHDNLILYGIITLPLLTCKRLIMNQMSLLYLH